MQTKRMFIKSSLLLLAALLASGAAGAKSCLWKVTRGEGSFYLQGSVHVLKPENHPLAPAIEEAYAKSDSLVLEVDMQDMVGAQQLIMQKAMLPAGGSLRATLDPEVYKQFEQACGTAGLPAVAVDGFKPWFASMTLSIIKMQKMGLNEELGLDKHFHTKALADGKPVVGFETMEFQIDLLDSLAEGDPNDFMKKSLKDLVLFEEKLDELLAAWVGGDIDTVGQLVLESFEDYPNLYTDFIAARNRNWIGKLEAMLESGKTHMVVVGAGHLPGKGGVLELLKAKGCKLEQL